MSRSSKEKWLEMNLEIYRRESTAATKMAALIIKSNTFRRRCKEKREELDRAIETKVSELRDM